MGTLDSGEQLSWNPGGNNEIEENEEINSTGMEKT